MNQLAEAWLARDYELDRDMEKFLSDVNGLLDKISDAKQSDPSEAFNEMRWSLSQFEDDFRSLKERLNELTVTSSKL